MGAHRGRDNRGKGPDVPPTRAPSGEHGQGVCAEFSPVQEGEKENCLYFIGDMIVYMEK